MDLLMIMIWQWNTSNVIDRAVSVLQVEGSVKRDSFDTPRLEDYECDMTDKTDKNKDDVKDNNDDIDTIVGWFSFFIKRYVCLLFSYKICCFCCK